MNTPIIESKIVISEETSKAIKKATEFIELYIKDKILDVKICEAKLENKMISEEECVKIVEEAKMGANLLGNLMDFLNSKKDGSVYLYFDLLSTIIKTDYLTDTESLELLVYILRRNAEMFEVNTLSIPILKIFSHDYVGFSSTEIADLIAKGKIYEIVNSNPSDLPERYQSLHYQIQSVISESAEDLSYVAKKTSRFLTYYDNPRDLDDAKTLTKLLKEIGFDTELTNMLVYPIKLHLLDELAKQDKKRGIKRPIKIKTPTIKKAEVQEKPKAKVYNEKEVREMNKFIRRYFDLYKVKVLDVPNFDNFMKCISYMEILDVPSMDIGRFIDYMLPYVIDISQFIRTYEEFESFLNCVTKYKVSRIYLDSIIRKYKQLRKVEDNPVAEIVNNYDMYTYYENKGDIDDLLSQLFITSDDDYRAAKELLEEYINDYSKHDLDTEFEYQKAKQKNSR